MATISRTVAVNAAFLQEIKDDNRQLRDLLQAARQLLKSPDCEPTALRNVAETLDQLRDQLALHFSLEDAYGYFEDAVTQAPQLSTQAESLRNEHGGLFLEISELADHAERMLYAEAAPYEPAELAKNFFRFFARFHAHEQHENDLIMAAFDDDIGVGD